MAIQYDPHDWILMEAKDAFDSMFRHDLAGCGETIRFSGNVSLEDIILTLQRHQHECEGYYGN